MSIFYGNLLYKQIGDTVYNLSELSRVALFPAIIFVYTVFISVTLAETLPNNKNQARPPTSIISCPEENLTGPQNLISMSTDMPNFRSRQFLLISY